MRYHVLLHGRYVGDICIAEVEMGASQILLHFPHLVQCGPPVFIVDGVRIYS